MLFFCIVCVFISVVIYCGCGYFVVAHTIVVVEIFVLLVVVLFSCVALKFYTVVLTVYALHVKNASNQTIIYFIIIAPCSNAFHLEGNSFYFCIQVYFFFKDEAHKYILL